MKTEFRSRVCQYLVSAAASPSLPPASQAASAPGDPAARAAVRIAREGTPSKAGRARARLCPPGRGPSSSGRSGRRRDCRGRRHTRQASSRGSGRSGLLRPKKAGPPRGGGAARVPVALEGVSIGASTRMVRVVAVAPRVAVSVALASRGAVVAGTGVAVIAVGVLSGRGSKLAGIAVARVVSAMYSLYPLILFKLK